MYVVGKFAVAKLMQGHAIKMKII